MERRPAVYGTESGRLWNGATDVRPPRQNGRTCEGGHQDGRLELVAGLLRRLPRARVASGVSRPIAVRSGRRAERSREGVEAIPIGGASRRMLGVPPRAFEQRVNCGARSVDSVSKGLRGCCSCRCRCAGGSRTRLRGGGGRRGRKLHDMLAEPVHEAQRASEPKGVHTQKLPLLFSRSAWVDADTCTGTEAVRALHVQLSGAGLARVHRDPSAGLARARLDGWHVWCCHGAWSCSRRSRRGRSRRSRRSRRNGRCGCTRGEQRCEWKELRRQELEMIVEVTCRKPNCEHWRGSECGGQRQAPRAQPARGHFRVSRPNAPGTSSVITNRNYF